MQVNSVMTPVVNTLNPETCLKDAAKRMKSLGVSCLPVEAGSELIGMVSFEDIAHKAVARGRNPMETPVSSVMSGQVAWCRIDQDTDSVAQIMKDWNQDRLAVLDTQDHAVGVVTLDSLSPRANDPLPIEQTIAAFEEYYCWSEGW
jgi:predicted transcriptional regulator